LALENRETETLVENFCLEALHDILEGEDLFKALNECEQRPTCLMSTHITNEQPPGFNVLARDLPPAEDSEMEFRNQNSAHYEKELKTVSGLGLVDGGETEIFRKRMFLENNFVDMVEYMLEDTLYNLMEEATYEEFDLTQAPKIYIRKDGGSAAASN
jgi:hypothetical protein